MAENNSERKPRLSEQGQIYVTLAAAEQWERANNYSGVEEARRDLTELLLDAYFTGDGSDGMVRRRVPAEGLDVQAHVIREKRLLVVNRVHVRDLNSTGRGQGRRRIVR